MTTPIEGYKGFNKDMTCRDFKFEVGQTYTQKGVVSICNSGFHMVENPLDVFSYYSPSKSVYAVVEGDGTQSKKDGDDSKIAVEKITIKASISVKALISASVEFVFKKVKAVKNPKATTGGGAHSATTGYGAHSATTGDYAHSATTGYHAHSATTGYGAHSATTGGGAHSATTGDYAHSATTGDYAHSATTGYHAHSATTGDYAHSATTGYHAHSATTGDYAISCSLGQEGKAKASKGSWLVLSEYKDGVVCDVQTVQVDGNKIKADTWYCLSKGKFTEVK